MAQVKQENLYKRLGTTANISQRRIKEKYIAAVKQHPPETDPERFEAIREAYETLKDPEKRKQYDITRKYGNKVESMVEEGQRYLGEGLLEQAEKIFQDILTIDPDHLSAQLGQMRIHVARGDFQASRHIFEQVLHNPALKDEDMHPAILYSSYGVLLKEHNEEQKAYDLMEEGWEQFSDHASLRVMSKGLSVLCINLGKYERGLEVVEHVLTDPEDGTINDIDGYMWWMRTIINSDYWSILGQAKSRFRKFIDKFTDEEDREYLLNTLMDEFDEAFEAQRYRAAEVFIALARPLNPRDSEIKEEIKEVEALARLEKQLKRLSGDERFHPLIIDYAKQLFLGIEDLSGLRSLDTAEEILTWDDVEDQFAFAAEISHVKKKYPEVYRYFKSDWDDLYADITKDFNREMKREIKKIKL